MTEIVDYYVVQTEENKEFFVSGKIKAIFFNDICDVIVPTEEVVINVNGKRFFHSSRTMPDYIIIGLSDISKSIVEKIERIKGVVQIIKESTNEGPKPSKLETSEVKRILKKVNKKEYKELSKVNVLRGQYAGYSGTINGLNGDELIVSLDIKDNPQITLPVWYVGREAEAR